MRGLRFSVGSLALLAPWFLLCMWFGDSLGHTELALLVFALGFNVVVAWVWGRWAAPTIYAVLREAVGLNHRKIGRINGGDLVKACLRRDGHGCSS